MPKLPYQLYANRELLWQTIVLIAICCSAAAFELITLGPEMEIAFLREETLYAGFDPRGMSAAEYQERTDSGEEISKAVLVPTAEQFCEDGKCDLADVDYILYISLETARDLFDEGEAQFVDARKAEEFAEGRIPFALNLPVAGFSTGWPDEVELLIKEMTVVVYCEGVSCDSSQLVGQHLVRYGMEKVCIIEPGFPAWKKAGLEVEQEGEL